MGAEKMGQLDTLDLARHAEPRKKMTLSQHVTAKIRQKYEKRVREIAENLAKNEEDVLVGYAVLKTYLEFLGMSGWIKSLTFTTDEKARHIRVLHRLISALAR